LSRSNKFFLQKIEILGELYHNCAAKTDISLLKRNICTASFYFLTTVLYTFAAKYKLNAESSVQGLIVDFSYLIYAQRMVGMIVVGVDSALVSINETMDLMLLVDSCESGIRSFESRYNSLMNDYAVQRCYNEYVSLKNVTIKSESGETLIKNANLSIGAGETLNISGKSGAGKSSLISCIVGRKNVSEGYVSMFGVPSQTIDSDFFVKNVGVCSAPFRLVTGTLYENICFGRSVTRGDAVNALGAVGALSLIDRLDHGVDSYICDEDRVFSNGELQRICIARAICCFPKILILDEATSGLDLESERDILDSIRLYITGLSIIIVRHGRIVENNIESVLSL